MSDESKALQPITIVFKSNADQVHYLVNQETLNEMAENFRTHPNRVMRYDRTDL